MLYVVKPSAMVDTEFKESVNLLSLNEDFTLTLPSTESMFEFVKSLTKVHSF